MNPRDIMNDAIHNFHPNYQQYTQYQSSANKPGGHSGGNGGGSKPGNATGGIEAAQSDVPGEGVLNIGNIKEPESNSKSKKSQGRQIPTISQNYTEKTTLLSSDDEFQ